MEVSTYTLGSSGAVTLILFAGTVVTGLGAGVELTGVGTGVGVDGAGAAAVLFFIVMLTVEATELFPEVSTAITDKVWLPSGKVVESKDLL